jgi:hypothetical protein
VLTGSETAIDVASPVSPVLVAVDDADDAPELPETATGVPTKVVPPPLPPAASAAPALDEPEAVWAPAGRARNAIPTIAAATAAIDTARGRRPLLFAS